MELLTKEQIFATDDIVTKEVEVSEWNGAVLIKSLTAKQRDLFEASILEDKGDNKKVILKNIRAKLVQRTAVDAEGKLLFFVTDIDAISEKNASPVDKLFTVAQELSGLTKKDVEDLSAPQKEEEEVGEKKSEGEE